MSFFERYLTWAVLCFVFAIIYTHFMMKQSEGKKLSFFQKLLYSFFIGLIVPLIILGVFKLLGVQIFG